MGFELKAEEMGVKIMPGYPPRGWWGSYDPDRHRIMYRPDLGHIQRRSTVWHELGHAYYGHVGCTPRQEGQARMWAARHLIRPAAFVEAARITDDPSSASPTGSPSCLRTCLKLMPGTRTPLPGAKSSVSSASDQPLREGCCSGPR